MNLVEYLITKADPGTVQRGDPLSERGRAELAKYKAMEAALKLDPRDPAARAAFPDGDPEAEQSASTNPIPLVACAERGQGPSRSERRPQVEVETIANEGAADKGPIQLKRRRTWTARIFGGAAAAALLLVAALVFNSLQTTPAAATPPMLVIDSSEVTTHRAALTQQKWTELQLASRTAAEAANGQLERVIRMQTWRTDSLLDEDGALVENVEVPHWYEYTFLDDGSVHELVTAGEPFAGQNNKDLPDPGTVLLEYLHAPGTFKLSSRAEPPTTAAEWGPYLASGVMGTPAAIDKIRELQGVLEQFPLAWEQRASLIEYLSTLEGLQYVGTTTDRLGRTGEAFRTADGGPERLFDALIIISPETGAISSIESIYIGEPTASLPSPRVIEYVTWSEPGTVPFEEDAPPADTDDADDELTADLRDAVDSIEATPDDDWAIEEHLECVPVGPRHYYCPLWAWATDADWNILDAIAVDLEEPEDPDLPDGDGSPTLWLDSIRALPVAEQKGVLIKDLREAIDMAPSAVSK